MLIPQGLNKAELKAEAEQPGQEAGLTSRGRAGKGLRRAGGRGARVDGQGWGQARPRPLPLPGLLQLLGWPGCRPGGGWGAGPCSQCPVSAVLRRSAGWTRWRSRGAPGPAVGADGWQSLARRGSGRKPRQVAARPGPGRSRPAGGLWARARPAAGPPADPRGFGNRPRERVRRRRRRRGKQLRSWREAAPLPPGHRRLPAPSPGIPSTGRGARAMEPPRGGGTGGPGRSERRRVPTG